MRSGIAGTEVERTILQTFRLIIAGKLIEVTGRLVASGDLDMRQSSIGSDPHIVLTVLENALDNV